MIYYSSRLIFVEDEFTLINKELESIFTSLFGEFINRIMFVKTLKHGDPLLYQYTLFA